MWAGRYWERDLRIALLSVSKESPVACCFLDMNGLKAINDNHPRGHEAGDDAMREYLRAIADNIEGVGDATAAAATRSSSSCQALTPTPQGSSWQPY